MDYFNISVNGRSKLAKWTSKRYRKLSIAELIRNSPDERTLFRMCEYIDRWYDENEPPMKPLEASTELSEEIEVQHDDSGDSQEDIDEVAPDVALKVEPEAPVKPQKEITKRTKGRINEFILNHPGAPISDIVNSAANEAELLRTIEEMENKVVPADIRVKLWTCRRL